MNQGIVTATANRLRVLRAERHLSQMDTATAAGISHNRYWRIENGYAAPTTEERQALAAVFAVAVEAVFPAGEAA